MPIFDQFHDPGYGRLKHLLDAHPGAAELLKEASIEDTEPDLPAGAYAWPERRLFPIHSREHAALSHLYAKTSEAEIPEHARAKIADALDVSFDELRVLAGYLINSSTSDEAAAQKLTAQLEAYPELKKAITTLLDRGDRAEIDRAATVLEVHRRVEQSRGKR